MVGIVLDSFGFYLNRVKLDTQLGFQTQMTEVRKWEYFPLLVCDYFLVYMFSIIKKIKINTKLHITKIKCKVKSYNKK